VVLVVTSLPPSSLGQLDPLLLLFTLAPYPLSFPLGTRHDVSAAQGTLRTLVVGEIEDFPEDTLQENTMRP